MAAAVLPQFHLNNLKSVPITQSSLRATLQEFRSAISRAHELLEAEYPAPDPADQSAFGNIFTGHLGVGIAYLRLSSQAEFISEDGTSIESFKAGALRRMNRNAMDLKFQPGRYSPLNSPSLGAVAVRMLAGLPDSSDPQTLLTAIEESVACNRVVELRGHKMGVDEVLAGRTGLLALIIDLFTRDFDDVTSAKLKAVYEAAPRLVRAIIQAGEAGSSEYNRATGGEAFPLMWSWVDGYSSLGAMHGITGILTVLLRPTLGKLLASAPETSPQFSIRDSYTSIAHTITAICNICVANVGHLPMAVPSWPSSRTSPLVQLCHGSPGLLMLLGAAWQNREFRDEHWDASWNETLYVCAQKTWEEGLLSKGAGLCHGVAGNAMPFLLVQHIRDHSNSNDDFLGRGLAMLALAQEAPPIGQEIGESRTYRTPDNPFSLFEGLAGTMCAWADACVVIQSRIRELELEKEGKNGQETEIDQVLQHCLQSQLGMPAFSSSALMR